MKVKSLSRVPLFVTPWTAARQAPPSMGFSRQEYWSGVPCPPPRDLPNSGIEPVSPVLQVDSLLSEPPGSEDIYENLPPRREIRLDCGMYLNREVCFLTPYFLYGFNFFVMRMYLCINVIKCVHCKKLQIIYI